MQQGVGGCQISLKKNYEDVRFNVTMGWVSVEFLEKKHYVTLEWPPKTEIKKMRYLFG